MVSFLMFLVFNYSAPISNLLSQILDVAGQRRFAPWPPANFNREYACKQSIHVEMWQVLNRYTSLTLS